MQVQECQLDELARRFEHRVGFFTNDVQRRYQMGSRWQDELVSAGYWGLFKALRNRRPEAADGELSAYVSQRIHGAVIDAARSCLTRDQRGEVVVEEPGSESTWVQVDGRGQGRWRADGPSDNPEEMAGRAWQQATVSRALGHLPPNEHRMMRAYMEGSSLTEIARAEGIALGTANDRFRKLARKLKARAPELRRILLDEA
jgi:RNA polymerase sigma factor (sigma-70 family)